ncbi:MAG: DUF2399 domain-containing protein, partial [Natronosporangium sp.]
VRMPARATFDRTERPPLPRLVWLPSVTPPAPAALSVVWHPELAWAADTRLTPSQRGTLERVNRWLHTQRDPLVVPMRERSIEIFGDEKALDRLLPTGLFGSGRLCLDLLRCRRVAPRMVTEPVGSGAGDLLLVVENSDTFDSLLRALRQTPGHRIGTVGWGAGAAFEGSVRAVDRAAATEICYFGDLDEKGLRTPTQAAALARRERLPPVRPATGLYDALLRLAHPQPGQRRVAAATAAALTGWLAPAHRDRAAALLTGGRRLAQEAVGLAHLLRTREWLIDLR